MTCSIQGCPGEYEDHLIVHTVKHGTELLVFEHVPAEVCDVCSDMLLTPKTVRLLEELIQQHPKPQKHASVFVYT